MTASTPMVVVLFVSSAAFVLVVVLGGYVLYSNPRSATNRMYALMTLIMALWCFGTVFLITAPDMKTALFWFRVASSGWGFVDLVALHFIFLLTQTDVFRRRWWLYVLYYLPGSFSFYGTVITMQVISDLKFTPYGWVYVAPVHFWWYIVNDAKMLACIITMVVVLVRWSRRSAHPLPKVQARIIILTILLSVAFFVSIVYSPFIFKTGPLPNMEHLVLVVWVAGMGYAILRYKLMVLTPEAIAPNILDTMAEALVLVDRDSRIATVNESAVRLFGHKRTSLVGRKITEFFPQEPFFRHDSLLALHTKGPVSNIETFYRDRSGAVIPLLLSASAVVDQFKQSMGIVAVLRDISERKQAEENLKFMATHDLLTNLPNRMILSDRLRQAIARARRYRHILAVMLIDLDHFKDVNDTLGHNTGDLLLKSVASRLKSGVRESDTVVRLGGDEFVVVLTDLAGADGVRTVATRLMEAFSRPFIIEGHELRVTLSMGISTFPSDGGNAEELLKYADLALYRAKDAGRNNCQFYTPEIESALNARVKLENDLRVALERNEFELFYQPIYDMAAGRAVTVEALLRWHHPHLGMVSPAAFIPIAEKTGLIVPIGKWVLWSACRQNRQWQDEGLAEVPVAVNISARQFMQPDLVETVEQVLGETGLESKYLELEITESVAMANIDTSVRVIDRLRERGIRFIIDDFGSGYSSLGWLKLLSIRALKIDRLFIQNIISDPYDAAIVKAIILMAHSLGIQVVAEGVETQKQLDFLRSLRWEAMPSLQCDRVQGFLLGRPMPADDLARVLGGTGVSRKQQESTS